ncbi:MAG: GtrA family protein [Prevotella sp.]|nr:GtrA family protein [Prevotella sp.]
MGKVGREIWTFCKAQLTAQIATLIDFAVTIVLAECAGLWYVWSSFLGALTGGLTNCTMNYRWVFDTMGLKRTNVLGKYLFVWTGSIVLNTLGTYALTELSQHYFIFPKIVVAVCVAVLWNYMLQRNFVYKETHLREKLRIEI